MKRESYVIQCPGKRGGKRGVRDGQIVLRADDMTTSRELCLAAPYEECKLCPNSNFEIKVPAIGDPQDFEWLDSVMSQAALAIEAEITKTIRNRQDCCFDHPDCIVVEAHFVMGQSTILNKETAKIIYDLIMRSSDQAGIAYKVLHVHILKQRGEFDIRIGMKKL